MKAVILAGGTGARLWPMSRQAKPKQFFDLVSEDPLIRDTYRRLLRLFAAEDIYFSVTPEIVPLLLKEFSEVPDERIIIEPEKRDTGPAMGYVAARLEAVCPDEPIVFIPSDHYIQDEELFLTSLRVGGQLVEKTGKLVDIAIQPTFPSTILGYTKVGKEVEGIDGVEGVEVYEFEGHTEKPPYEVAKRYLEDGSYLWHANYYMWTPRKFMEAFEKYAPAMGQELRAIQSGSGDYSALEKISIDYAVTEKMNPEDVLIIKGDFGWSDVGAWDTLHDRLTETGDNVFKGKCVTIDTDGSLIYGPADKLIAVVGMKDVIIVDTGDSLLVCHKKDAQRVKELHLEIEKGDHQQHL